MFAIDVSFPYLCIAAPIVGCPDIASMDFAPLMCFDLLYNCIAGTCEIAIYLMGGPRTFIGRINSTLLKRIGRLSFHRVRNMVK